MSQFFPPSFIRPEAKPQVIEWIRTLPITPPRRKDMLMWWSEETGVQLTAEDYRQAQADEPVP